MTSSVSFESTADQYVAEFVVFGLYILAIPPMSLWRGKYPDHPVTPFLLLSTKLLTLLAMYVEVLYIVRKWKTDSTTWFYAFALVVQSLYMYGLSTPKKDERRHWLQLPMTHLFSIAIIATPIISMGASAEISEVQFELEASDFCLTYMGMSGARPHTDFINLYDQISTNAGRVVNRLEGFQHQGSFKDKNVVCDVLVEYHMKEDGSRHYEHVKYHPDQGVIVTVAANLTEEEAKIHNLKKTIVTP